VVTFAVSDLHLSDDERPSLFTDAKERVFVALAAELDLRGGELVLAGDVFDLTAMSAPAMGLGDFFRDALPRDLGAGLRASVPARSAALRLESIHRRFPAFFEALRPLAHAGRLTILPGNHDCELNVASARAALATEIGASGEPIRFAPTRRVSDFALVSHGHVLDASNVTEKSCQNRGAAMTQALEAALAPALAALGVPPDVVQAVAAVRPEENVVAGVARWIGAERASKLLRAFVDLLRKNRYFEGLGDIESWLARHPKGESVRADDVLELLADDSDLKAQTRKAALRVLDGKALAPDGKPPPRVLAMGHTHELDALSRYVNLGSWVDQVRGISPGDLIKVDRTLPVLSIDGETAVLRDAGALPIVGRLDLCPRLWVYRG
jgi:UDP-2,3-diacylglucosamine pyrophosphatase LpxH